MNDWVSESKQKQYCKSRNGEAGEQEGAYRRACNKIVQALIESRESEFFLKTSLPLSKTYGSPTHLQPHSNVFIRRKE